jgi:L-malate glycosyltransferase
MALAAGGDEVHVITLLDPRLRYHEVVVPQYPLFEYPPYSLALATKMVEVTRHHGLDLLHVHYAVPNAVSAVLAREILKPLPLRVVTTLHGTDITLVGNDPSFLETTRYSIEQSDGVTAVSESLRRATIDQFGIQRRVDVVPNFIDPVRFESARKSAGARRFARPGEKVLVHISNFRPIKRILDAVEVFLRVRREMPAKLLLVGDGPDRAKVEQRCRRCDDCEDIVFLGNLPVVEEVLVGADLFLLPSETESFGLAALEALSCEVPVITTRVGGLPEVVQEGVNGFLLPVGDVDGMTAAALRLLQDEPLRQAFAAAARRWAVEQFSQDRIVGQYRALYERVLAGSFQGH